MNEVARIGSSQPLLVRAMVTLASAADTLDAMLARDERGGTVSPPAKANPIPQDIELEEEQGYEEEEVEVPGL